MRPIAMSQKCQVLTHALQQMQYAGSRIASGDGGKVTGRLALRARWQEEANHLHISCIVAAHTHVHAVVLQLADRGASSEDRLAMLRSNNDLWGAPSCRYKLNYAFDRCTVPVMAALVWIPIMGRCGRGKDR